MKRKGVFFLAIIVLSLLNNSYSDQPGELNLAGTWQFQLDPDNKGVSEQWFNKDLQDTITLPGATDENKKGPGNSKNDTVNYLTRTYPYWGAAWYQKKVEIPKEWAGKQISLVLERTKRTSVWIDKESAGGQDSLAVMQTYNLSSILTPGMHTITIVVDNKKNPPVYGHQIAEDTQTNWNGIVGQIALVAQDPVWIADTRIYADIVSKKIKAIFTIGNKTGKPAFGKIVFNVKNKNAGNDTTFSPEESAVSNLVDGATISAEYEMGSKAQLWDEFTPVVYELRASLETAGDGTTYKDSASVEFGLREFKTKDKQFCINGKTIFLRGKHDACVFPLTGYAPMDTEGWQRVFRIAKTYGINHYRFHTWCPPEAAFAAADREGIYLQPELPNFGIDISKDPAKIAYNKSEALRIIKTYGNHPSFVMFAMGNEIGGGQKVRKELVQMLQKADPRRLYAQASNYDLGKFVFQEGDDYWTTMRNKLGPDSAVRGSFAHVDIPLGHIQQTGVPSTMKDYSAAIRDITVPVVSHEIGQYQVSPNYKEIEKYTGVVYPRNFEIFRDRLSAKGMLDEADAFFKASGALSVICYREDIEAALRTPKFGGFQLLDLQDFPGQGTALVGILDAFMDSKGLIQPEEWRQFCSSTVPLLLIPKYTWRADETIEATIKAAHYGAADLKDAKPAWQLLDQSGKMVLEGKLDTLNIPQGTLTEIGTIKIPLKDCNVPQKMTIKISLNGTEFTNKYPIWVYSSSVDIAFPENITVSRVWDEETQNKIQSGKPVLLIPELKNLPGSIEGFFASDFWCYPMFRSISEGAKKPIAPGTLGILCDPQHPALAAFPTESHSNWQWWNLVMNSRSVILDDTPKNFRPIIQVIDNFERNHKLGLLFEGKIGKGNLLMCSMDLLGNLNQPECRQMLYSLLQYMQSGSFNPKTELPAEFISKIVTEKP